MLDRLAGSAAAAADFASRAWPRRWTVLRGAPERWPALFLDPALADLRALLATNAPTELWWEDDGIRAAGAEPFSAARLYQRGGLTLRFMNADAHVPTLRAALDGLIDALGTPVRRSFANVYLTPPGVRTAMHFDGAEVFIVQISGTKIWQVADNLAVESPGWGWAGGTPDAEEQSQLDGPLPAMMPEPAVTLSLHPGDILFLPRGCWHAATAEQESISVSLALECLTRLDVALDIIRRAAIGDSGWRQPAAGMLTPEGKAALNADLAQLGAALQS